MVKNLNMHNKRSLLVQGGQDIPQKYQSELNELAMKKLVKESNKDPFNEKN